MIKDLISAAVFNLEQLKKVLTLSTNLHYCSSLQILFKSTIGMHVRHILEFYQCLVENNTIGKIDYDNRNRNSKLETDLEFSTSILDELIVKIKNLEQNDSLILLNDNPYSASKLEIPTNTLRELTYLIEHTIHHMAIIKMAYTCDFKDVVFEENFGVAYSTIKFNNSVHSKLSAG